MKKKFNHVDDLDGLEVPERKTVDGKRVYVTPEGNSYPVSYTHLTLPTKRIV